MPAPVPRTWIFSLLLVAAGAAHAVRPDPGAGSSPYSATASTAPTQAGARRENKDPGAEQGATAPCTVAATTLVHARQRAVLVDVRSAERYAQIWIPGSANLDMAMLAGNLLVKSAPMAALVGSGKDLPRLLRRCQSLHRDGLPQVRVLLGGLPAWHRAGGPVAGNTALLDQPLVLSNAELRDLLVQGGNTLVFVDSAPTRAFSNFDARIVRVAPKGKTPRELLRELAAQVPPGSSVIVLLSGREEISRWRTDAQALGMPDPFFYTGSPARYDRYLEQLATVATAASSKTSMCKWD